MFANVMPILVFNYGGETQRLGMVARRAKSTKYDTFAYRYLLSFSKWVSF